MILTYIGTEFECTFDEDGDLQEVLVNGEEIYIYLSEKTKKELTKLAQKDYIINRNNWHSN